MRVLLYGGCHAQVLRDYFELAFPGEFRCSLIINFDLIRSGVPFPYELLDRCDVVVFSPIENKGDYNTVHLVEACRRIGLAAICFPWLEWHGYNPGMQKGLFQGRIQWFYPALAERAAAFRGGLDEFCEDIAATFPDPSFIDQIVQASTDRLREAEQRAEIEFSLTDLISEHFRTSRLFLTPDHPSRFCYLALFAWILDRMGVPPTVVAARLQGLSLDEPQWRWRIPVFPSVARRLSLQFDDTAWLDNEIIPERSGSLRDYLALYLQSEKAPLGRASRVGAN